MAEEAKKIELPKGKLIAKVTHYFRNIGVAVLQLSGDLKVGDTIVISGGSKEFEQNVDSMQVEHSNVATAKAGDAVGMKTAEPVKEGYQVFLKG